MALSRYHNRCFCKRQYISSSCPISGGRTIRSDRERSGSAPVRFALAPDGLALVANSRRTHAEKEPGQGAYIHKDGRGLQSARLDETRKRSPGRTRDRNRRFGRGRAIAERQSFSQCPLPGLDSGRSTRLCVTVAKAVRAAAATATRVQWTAGDATEAARSAGKLKARARTGPCRR